MPAALSRVDGHRRSDDDDDYRAGTMFTIEGCGTERDA